MKRYKLFSLMAATLALGACSNDALIEGEVTPGEAQTGEAIAFAGAKVTTLDMLDEEGADGAEVSATRSTLENGEFTGWTVGDKVSVSDGTLNFTYKVTKANGTNCTFDVLEEGNNKFTGDASANKSFYCCYPAAAVKGWNGSTVTAMVYAEQNYEENKDGGAMGAYMVTSAEADETGNAVSFNFAHAASVVEVNLSSLDVTPKAVYLKSNSGVAIAGEVKCDVSDRSMTVSTTGGTAYCTSSQSDVIALTNVASNATIARFYILPVKLVGGVTVTVVDTDGNYYTKKTSTDIGNDADFTVTNGITVSDYQVKPGTTTAAKPYYKKVNFGTAASATRKGNWMATIPSNTYYSMMSAPGTHDAATSTCDNTPVVQNYTKCQGSTISEQLTQGVRVFDLRPGYKYNSKITADNLYIYHGAYTTNVLYVDAMDIFADFLADNPTEAITIVQVKEEGSGSDRSDDMWSVINNWQDSHAGIFLAADHSNWALNDMRGKIMFVNRNKTATHKGQNILPWDDKCNVTDWSSNIGGLYYDTDWRVNGTCHANIQDAYGDNETNKKAKVTQQLNLMSRNETKGRYTFNFLSIAGDATSTSKSHAQTMNPYATSELAKVSGPVGYIMADHVNTTQYGVPLVKAVINQNYKYVFNGRTRNVAATEGIGVEVAGDEYADDTQVYARPM